MSQEITGTAWEGKISFKKLLQESKVYISSHHPNLFKLDVIYVSCIITRERKKNFVWMMKFSET